MLTPRQFDTFTPKRKQEIRHMYVFIPRNDVGVRPGYYRDGDIVHLLRQRYRSKRTVLFVANVVGRAALKAG